MRISTATPSVAICHMAALIDAAEGDERRPDAAVVLAPRAQGQEEAEALDPAADHHQREADVERPAGLERRVEGVEHGGLVEQDRDGGHQQTDDHRPEPDPVDRRVAERPAEAVDRREGGEPDDEERRPDQGVEHTVEGEALVVALDDRLEVLVEVDARELEGLQRAEQAADAERDDRDADVAADEPAFPLRQLVAGGSSAERSAGVR